MMRIMKRNDPNNQPNLTQFSRINKTGSENSRIIEENRGTFSVIQASCNEFSNKNLPSLIKSFKKIGLKISTS